MMDYYSVEHCCSSSCTPPMLSKNVRHRVNYLWRNSKSICNTVYSSDGFLNIRSPLCLPRLFRWTLPYTRWASPLGFNFSLNVKSKPIHPAPSLRMAQDYAIGTLQFYAERLNFCPMGVAERIMLNSIVLSLWLCDGACKARFAVRGRTLKLFIAWAIQSLHGSFDFPWGETSSRIFDLLPQIKKRISHYCAGAQSLLCVTGVTHSSKKPSHLNTLRVVECNFTVKQNE